MICRDMIKKGSLSPQFDFPISCKVSIETESDKSVSVQVSDGDFFIDDSGKK